MNRNNLKTAEMKMRQPPWWNNNFKLIFGGLDRKKQTFSRGKSMCKLYILFKNGLVRFFVKIWSSLRNQPAKTAPKKAIIGLERDLEESSIPIPSLKKFLVMNHNSVLRSTTARWKALDERIWENYQHRRFQFRWWVMGQNVKGPNP